MSYRFTVADGEEFAAWNGYLKRSPHAGPFHQREALELLADHTDTTLHPLLAYKGEQVIGVLPLFEGTKGPFTTVVSPPSGTEVYYLGTALCDVDGLKQRKLDRRARRFVEGSIEWIDSNLDPDITHIRTVDRYTDLRPFSDSGFDVTPYYTYITDLTPSEDDLLMALSSDARSNVTKTDESEYNIEVGGLDDAREIIERVRERHEEQGEPYHITREYIDRLYTDLPEGQVRPYVCDGSEGEMAGGIVTVEFGDTIYRWQGGTKADVEIPVNDLLDWHVIRDARERGLERYDFVGANTERICRYKSKFAPELVHYHGALKRSPAADLAVTARSLVAKVR